jgi:hypothetical protein
MTRSELAALAAALKRIDAVADGCLLLIHGQHPSPPSLAGLIRRTDNRPHQEPIHG